MGLAVSVGQLAFLHSYDPEGVDGLRAAFRAVNRLLVLNNLPPHHEPESLPEIPDRIPVGSMPYSWLHYARRAVAYALSPGKTFRPLGEDEEPNKDPVYNDVLFSSQSHMVCHSDCGGFYVPIDFPEPLYDDLPDDDPVCIEGGILGSSQGALRELLLAAPLLDIPLVGGRLTDEDANAVCREAEEAHPHWIARQAWLCMHERLRQSIEFRSAVVFG